MKQLTIQQRRQPGATYSGIPKTFFSDQKLGEFPLLQLYPLVINGKNYLAPAWNITVFKNIANGHARILTYDLKMTSIFTLKCHFHSNNRKFTFRSDKFPGSAAEQWQRMVALAKNYAPLSYSMQLYDNRRAAPDDLLVKWTGTEITFEHDQLPFAPEKFTEAQTDAAIYWYQQNKNKQYETATQQVQL